MRCFGRYLIIYAVTTNSVANGGIVIGGTLAHRPAFFSLSARHGITLAHHFETFSHRPPHPSSPSILQRHMRSSIPRQQQHRGYERSSVARRIRSANMPLVWSFLNVVAIRPSAEIYPPKAIQNDRPGCPSLARRELASSTQLPTNAAQRQATSLPGPWAMRNGHQVI